MDLADWIERQADFTPDKAALRFEGDVWTYHDLALAIARTAGALRELGVHAGDTVAYLGLNNPHELALLFACARLGAIFAPLNWRLAPAEHRQVLNDCHPAVLVVEAPFAESIAPLCVDAPAPRLVVLGTVPRCRSSGEALLESAAPLPPDVRGGSPDAPVLLCYTSGSTGKPKGALLTQAALFWNAVNSTHMHDLTRADRILTTLPLFHVGGLNILTLPALHAGATVVLHPKFDAGAALAAIQGEGITLTVLVPAQLDMMMASERWPEARLSSLRCISTGSTIVPPRLFAALHARGVPLIQVYGSTETSPIATYVIAADAAHKPGSAGKAGLHCSVRVVDADAAVVPPGVAGEIVVQGPNVMAGYLNAPSATADALRDGWFHTGDIGHFDEEGYLWVDGRRSDMIISGGENIYPAEIENALIEAGIVEEVAVIGKPDDKWGEMVVAVVVPKTGQVLRDADVLGALQGRIARYKQPREIVFLDALPKSALGKVRRDELRRLVRERAVA